MFTKLPAHPKQASATAAGRRLPLDATAAPQPLAAGTRLGLYTVLRVLGIGGFGITYAAREDITRRTVAIKEHYPGSLVRRGRGGITLQPATDACTAEYALSLQRFREEARMLVGVHHPNVVPSLAYFEGNGTGYLVMAYQEGETLAQMLEPGHTLAEAETLALALPLLDGIEHVHGRRLLHRDIKPGNILVLQDGVPVLLDFGAAQRCDTSPDQAVMLTEGYAPLEQYGESGEEGPWTDLHALGAVMFRCLVGRAPPSARARAAAIARGAPDPMAGDFALLRRRVGSDLAFAIEATLRIKWHERPLSVAHLRGMISSPVANHGVTPTRLQLPAHETATTILLGGNPKSPFNAPLQFHAATVNRRGPGVIRPGLLGMALLLAIGGVVYSAQGDRWLAVFDYTSSRNPAVASPAPSQGRAASPSPGPGPVDWRAPGYTAR